MPQKVLAGRSDDPLLSGDLVRVKVDQVVLARDPLTTVAEAVDRKLKKCAVETAVAYETRCVTSLEDEPRQTIPRALVQKGLLVARPGIGFPAAVHLERFASPARLALTDDPRVAACGGVGMLTLLAPPALLAEALTQGSVLVRPPRSIQILLSGRMRPFVCVRDVALELLRRGLSETVLKIDREYQAPVILEFAGPSARVLSVPDRAAMCGLAAQVGAAGALFVSDEKTEVYLRDQRRSKAHRALVPDAGAPCDDVVNVDLSAVDPLLLDNKGVARPVRDLAGEPVSQVMLGGDTGASLRDLLAVATLLKSKRVPPELEFLLAPQSRQVLEVLAQSGALVDLVATGARLVEPDFRVLSGELYPPKAQQHSLRTFDPEPVLQPTPAPATADESPTETRATPRPVIASAETLAYAVAYGEIGDPRSFKRPVRVTVPRALPTDDVLVVRRGKGRSKTTTSDSEPPMAPNQATPWQGETQLTVVARAEHPQGPSALVLSSAEEVNWAVRHAPQLQPSLRALISSHIPSGSVPLLSGLGILALEAPSDTLERLRLEKSIAIPAPETWNGSQHFRADIGSSTVELRWLAVDAERDWTARGTSRSPGK